ncbi:MAG: ABC transporter ATP-binding protein, partial [Rhodobacterales bacterium]|nr:ABC transporter ATP-binding protein [Rhodobacterales bacterium]
MSALWVDVRFARTDFSLDATLDIPGEGICVLLGPSGSGKTTLMRLIAGLERPSDGVIRLGEETWFDKKGTSRARIDRPVGRRRIGIVFQDYALFENMTVAANIGYGAPRATRAADVAAWIERLDLHGLETRYPSQLSGGQRQRVALARALAADPDLLLLDEPFSAVDAHLRNHLRAHLMGLAAAVKKPVVMVTHDLEEARQVADTVGVVCNGRLNRFGLTHEVFNDPGEHAVACVLGWRNLLPLDSFDDDRLAGAWGQIRLGPQAPFSAAHGAAWVGIRPEHIELGGEPGTGLEARVVRVREMGAVRELQCRLMDGRAIFVQRPWNMPLPAPGEAVWLHLPAPR